MKKFLSLIIFFNFANSATAQSNKSDKLQSQSVINGVKKSNISNAKVDNNTVGVKLSDRYHENGKKVESQLNDQLNSSDKNLTEKEFIIERSPNVIIEYSPSEKKSKN